jgi:DNA-binding NtrC family response regulator
MASVTPGDTAAESPRWVRAQAQASADVLVVEDKESLRKMLRLALEHAGHRVIEAGDQVEAAAAIAAHRPAVVISDLRLPVGDGFGVLRAAKEVDSDLAVIVMTAYGGVEDAVRAMREGALDFLAKPVDPDHLVMRVDRAIEQRRLAAENLLLREELAHRRGAPDIIGAHPTLRELMHAVRRAAGADTTVLVEGESGTGKELVARAVHAWSPRADGPFVAINCAAIPETLLETELFGHERGAFTGAVGRKSGKFEVAHRGTLFLDEIGELPLPLQAKVLRAIEHKQFERVGGNLPVRVDARIVAATNANLRAAVAARRFREDLYFRLSVFPIAVPPLRERRSDIPLLAEHFLDRFCRDQKKRRLALSPGALEALHAYAWPGNVRELQNCLERAVILTEGGVIEAAHLQLSAGGPSVAGEETVGVADPWDAIDLSGTFAEATRRALAEVERRKLAGALAEAGGDRARAGALLELPPRFLAAKLREHKLD